MKLLKRAILILLLLGVMQACSLPERTTSCPAVDLLLDETSLPPGTTAYELILSPLPDGPRNSVSRTFSIGQGIASHQVYGFSSRRRAEQEFESRYRSPVFSDPNQRWLTPEQLHDSLGSSTRHAVGCGQDNSIPMCRAIAQYENYYIFFNIHVYPEETSIADVSRALRAIDGQMRDCLDNSTGIQPQKYSGG